MAGPYSLASRVPGMRTRWQLAHRGDAGLPGGQDAGLVWHGRFWDIRPLGWLRRERGMRPGGGGCLATVHPPQPVESLRVLQPTRPFWRRRPLVAWNRGGW